MSNKSKRKGTDHENAVVWAFQANGWPDAERRAQRGINDAGDISGVPLTVECKNEARVNLAGWWKEVVKESAKNGGLPPVVIAKRRGKSNGLDAWAIMDLRTLLRLLP